MKTHYQILGVAETASLEEIKSAYRKLARQYHPDVAKTKEAEERFKEINRAYEVLSDSLKRADYDQFLKKESYVKTPAREEAVWDRSLLYAAYSRIAAYTVTFTLAALAWELFIWWMVFADTRSFSLSYALPGLVCGFLLGTCWGADANFKVETFLGAGVLGRTYTFLRTMVMSIGAGYFLGLIGMATDKFFYNGINWLTFVFFMIGIIIGATLGSDGDAQQKLFSGSGRFGLLYTALRGIEIGAIVGLAGFIIGLLIVKFGGPATFVAWGAFFGFVIGDIAGSIAPANLTAYASYASAYVTSILVLLMVGGAMVLGTVFGTFWGEKIAYMLGVIWQGIVGLF